MYALEIYGLTKHFGNTIALKEVSVNVLPEELLTILGPAGSGKTTLLRLISGLDTPDQGTILIGEKNIARVAGAKKQIGMVFQDTYGLIPHIDVFENIAMPLKLRAIQKKNVRSLVLDTARILEVHHLLERRVSTLSRGERLGVALARALIKDPTLLLLDDVFMGLDTPTRLTVRRLLVSIQQARQIPCLFATSDQSDAFALSDRVVLLNEGRVQQIGTRSELTYKPATLWVSQWVGFPPMNTLTGTLQGTYHPEGLCYRVWTKGFAPFLPLKWSAMLRSLQSQEIVLGIRPENIIPEWEFQEKWKPHFYTIKVKVKAKNWDQGKSLVQLQLPNTETEFLALFDISFELLHPGLVITVAFDPEEFCLFDARAQTLLQAPPVSPARLRR